MCHECEQITVEVGTLVLLAEAERIVIDAEAQSGASVPGAVRPMLPQEIAAKVRFGDIEGLTGAALAEATQVLEGLRAVIVGAVLGEMLGDADEVTPADAGRALAQLNAAQPVPVQTAVARTATALQTILAGVAAGAGNIVVEEAKRQGVKLGDYTPPVVDPEVFKLPAAAAALHPWQRITGKLQTTILDPAKVYQAGITRGDVQKELDNIPLDGTKDLAKQTIHSAHGIGRNETAATFDPTEIYASEIMDGNTCARCAQIDGHEYQTMEQARADYPNGGYGKCLGGTRCRGTLVFMYDLPRGKPDPNPDPLPPILPPEPEPAPVKPPRKRAPRKPKVAPIVPDPTPAPAVPPAPKVPDTPPATPDPVAPPMTRKQALANERNKAAVVPPVAPAAPPAAPAPVPGLPPAPTGTPPKRKPGKTQRYTAIDQLPIQATPPRADWTVPKALREAEGINPGHDKTYVTKIYNHNCSSVVQAYEMRRRGYDVVAAPVAGGSGRWHGEYVDAWWTEQDGTTPAKMLYVNQLPNPSTRKGFGGRKPRVGSAEELRFRMDDYIESFPDGARGFVALQWQRGGGHVFSWEKINGKAVYLEGQTGEADASGHVRPEMFKPGHLRVVRIDDKKPRDFVADALETRPPELQAELDKAKAEGSLAKNLSSVEKKNLSIWRIQLIDGKRVYIAPRFRKGANGRWEEIPEAERTKMAAEREKEANDPNSSVNRLLNRARTNRIG